MSSFTGQLDYIWNDGVKYSVGFFAEYSGAKVRIDEVEVQEIFREDKSELPEGNLWMDIAQAFPHGDGIEEALIKLAEKDQQWEEDRKIKDRILGRR